MLAATLLLAGCGIALRLGYNQGPSLAFRWLDGYAEFDDAQSLRVRAALDEFFNWHRRTQANCESWRSRLHVMACCSRSWSHQVRMVDTMRWW